MPRRSKRTVALAEEAWQLLVEMIASQRERSITAAASFGLSPGDSKALLTLDVDDPPTMRQLATAWACDASNVTWLVDRLERHGLVERRTSPKDRRVKTVALTDHGLEVRESLQTGFLAAPDELAELSVDDLEKLTGVLRKVATRELASRDDAASLSPGMPPFLAAARPIASADTGRATASTRAKAGPNGAAS